jgi:hypothetical protein
VDARKPVARGAGVLRRLCAGHGAVDSRRGGHDARRGRAVRPAARHGDRLVREHDRRHPRLPRGPLPAAPAAARPLRRAPQDLRPGDRARRRVLPVHAAPRAAVPLLHDQPAHRPDGAAHLDLLLGQPARHAARHRGLRVRRDAAGAHRIAIGRALAGPGGRLRADRPDAAADALAGALAAGPARLSRPPEAAQLRLQPRGDRGRIRGARHQLHRRRREGEGRADREAPHGRRLPEHRLRAVQGADPLGPPARGGARCGAIRSRGRGAEVRLRNSDGARARGHRARSSRTIPSSATPSSAWR